MKRPYIIGAGYHGHPGDGRADFYSIWMANVRKHSRQARVIVISDSDSDLPETFGVHAIRLSGNLGYCGDLIHKTMTGHFPGGPAVLMALAMLAYIDECDLVYQEQDCLCFGDCIGQMYAEIFNGGIVFGRNHQKVLVENCLFLLKHEFIPEFVSKYSGSEPETIPESICENKFLRWMQDDPVKWRYHSMRGGRDRPLPYDDKHWYCQKVTPQEMVELKRRELI